MNRLIRLVKSDPDPLHREMAAHALGNLRDARATTALRDVLRNRAEDGTVRGVAAEQLVFRKAAVPDLLAGLRDTSREVRFWSAYALGEGRIARALPALRQLTRDRSRVRGWWSIAREARWAIATIEAGWTGDAPDPWKPVKTGSRRSRR